MPKKTKKEKLRADTHRQPTQSRRDQVFTSEPLTRLTATSPIIPTYTMNQTTLKHAPRVEALQVEQTAIKLDIVKTISWSALIIMAELLLSRYFR